MRRAVFKRMTKNVGLPPGTLVHGGGVSKGPVKVRAIHYAEKECEENDVVQIEECSRFKKTEAVTWINVDGVHDVSIVEKIGAAFDIHPLVLEDIANTAQRPKFEEFDEHIFVVLKMLTYDDEKKATHAEHVSLVVGKNYVLTFQEEEGDVFTLIRERLRLAKGRIRKMKADYLAYALIDAIVDHYFLVLEKIGDATESLEEELVNNPSQSTQHAIYTIKREILFLRKAIWPLREVISTLARGESGLIKKTTEVYFRDVYDHTVQIIDTIETVRDIVSGLLDLYLSSLSNRMNEVMKVLTIIATIFIPITFVAGIYGMNFNPEMSRWNMPELNSPYGYIGAWIVMLVIAGVMIGYFKRKKWL